MAKRRRRLSSAFYDLNIDIDHSTLANQTITTALQLGFSGIALNHTVKGAMLHSDSCKNRALNLAHIAAHETNIALSAKFHQDVLGVSCRRPFLQYHRLTVVVDSAVQAAALNASNPVIRSYDLVAIRPMNQKVFDQACTHLEVDLISFDCCHRFPFRLKGPSIKAAMERGILFEIIFSGAFVDLKARRELIANAQMLEGLTRGRSTIISSGARQSMELRGPNDVANMGTMFGLSREAAKAAVSKNCEDAILHGFARKMTYKSAIMVNTYLKGGTISPNEGWFTVPKVWDPLSNTSMADSFSLPEKTEAPSGQFFPNMVTSDEGDQEKEFVMQRWDLDSEKSIFPTAPSKNLEEIIPADREDFVGIDFSETRNCRISGSRKRSREGRRKQRLDASKPDFKIPKVKESNDNVKLEAEDLIVIDVDKTKKGRNTGILKRAKKGGSKKDDLR